MMSTNLPSQVLRGGKEHLLTRGWTKKSFQAEDGSVCAWGALNLTQTGDARCAGYDMTAYNILRAVVGTDSIPDWNDSPSTDFNDVMDAFDLAEKKALMAEEGIG